MTHDSLITTVQEQLAQIFVKGCTWCWAKVPLAFALASFDFLIGMDNQKSMEMVLALIIIDLITAVAAEYKVGHPIESRKALKTVTKIVIYGLMVAGAHLAEGAVPGTTFFDTAAISFLAITELISILENIGKAGYAIPKKLLNRLDDLRDK